MHHSPKTQSEPCKVEDSEAQKPLLKQWNANWLGHQNHILLYIECYLHWTFPLLTHADCSLSP